jgi:hypothetical protein
MGQFRKDKPQSVISQNIAAKRPAASTNNFKVSFQYLDTTQKFGSTFKDWQSCGLLSKAMDTLQGYCCSPLRTQLGPDKFKAYGAFPTKESLFSEPANSPEDAEWARIHVNGPAVLAGHILEDTFFVVFLDKTHKFYMGKKEREKHLGKKSLK